MGPVNYLGHHVGEICAEGRHPGHESSPVRNGFVLGQLGRFPSLAELVEQIPGTGKGEISGEKIRGNRRKRRKSERKVTEVKWAALLEGHFVGGRVGHSLVLPT